jgi:glycosyltransferase involved in cell wall biosynthesis
MIHFSIIIPVFNRPELLKNSLNSILLQNYTNWECLIIDDGSTSDIKSVVSSFNEDRFKYHRFPNMGAAIARNIGIGLAKFDWIAFLDSDDTWEINKLERMAEIIDSKNKSICYFSAFRFKDFSSNETISTHISPPPNDIQKALRISNPIHVLPSFVASKAALLEINGFDPTFKARQDVDLYFRLAKSCSFVYLSEVLCNIYLLPSERISTNPNNRLAGFISFYNKHASSFTFSEKNYLSKRIVYYAWRSRKFWVLLRYFPRAVISRLHRSFNNFV